MDDPLRVAFAILFPFLVGVVVVVAWFLWRSVENDRSEPLRAAPQHPAGQVAPARGHSGIDLRMVGAWLALSAISDALAWAALFAIVHILLFAFGTAIAWVGVAVSGLMLAAIPILWALALRHWARQRGR